MAKVLGARTRRKSISSSARPRGKAVAEYIEREAAGCEQGGSRTLQETEARWGSDIAHDIDVVVIAAEVEDQDQIELQLRRPTIKLKPGPTVKDILWELSNLFPGTQQSQ